MTVVVDAAGPWRFTLFRARPERMDYWLLFPGLDAAYWRRYAQSRDNERWL